MPGPEIVLITGTRKGIGRHLAEHFVRKGALVEGRDADLAVLHLDDRAPIAAVPPYWAVPNGIYRGLDATTPPSRVPVRG